MPTKYISKRRLHNQAPWINFRFIAYAIGNMCLLESGFLVLCVLVSLLYRESSLGPFLWTALIMVAVALLLRSWGKEHTKHRQHVGSREGMLAVTLSWITLSAIGMLPFVFGGYTPTVADAFFETVSGFTTTGATVFEEIENLPHALLLWRSMTQWQGGIGIIFFTLALPQVNSVGSSSLYNAETTGIKHERFLPRIAEVARRLWGVYVGLTLLLVLLLWAGPMNLFDAVCHAFSCISTGGFSTHNNGVLHFNSAYVEYVLTLFMFIGSINFTWIYMSLAHRSLKRLYREEEFRWFVGFLAFFIVATFLWLFIKNIYASPELAFRRSIFQVITLTSSTGFTTAENVNEWHSFFFSLGIVMMTVGGCAGSTSGGFKIGRFMVMVKNLSNEFKKRIHPSMVTNVRFNGKAVDTDVVIQVLAFVGLYLGVIIISTFLLCLAGNSFLSSVSDSVTCISNVGPSFGPHAMNFSLAGSFEKVVLSLVMLAGRLEVFTLIGIFVPSFWRK